MVSNQFLSVLNESEKDDRNVVSKKELQKFLDENLFGKVINVKCGTSITRYDINLTPQKIGYMLSAGKMFMAFFNTNNIRLYQNGNLVCVEIPNKYRGIYGLKDCAKKISEINSSDNDLIIPIGEGLDGECITYNLVDMPHLLVAGQTGSGKSIFLQNIILSLIMQYTKEDVNLILIDPKQVELGYYRNVPCVREVITTTQRAEERILDLHDEMINRYKAFAEAGARDIKSYNEISGVKMPRIVVVIEELAEIATDESDEAIKSIGKLLNTARASGIHLILSTQRPDSAFISGKIKNNFECRVIFSMASAQDSRVALGRKGAEMLKGNGDGIFRSNNGQENTRFQSPNVTEKEIKDVVKILTQKGG